MEREKSFVKNIIILLFGTVFPKFTSILILPILTGMLTPEELGSYDVVLTVGAMLLPITTLQIQAAAFRFLVTAKEDHKAQSVIITNITVFVVVSSFVTLVGVYLLLDQFLVVNTILKYSICLYLFSDVLVNVLRQFARGLGKVKIYTMSTIINAIMEFIFIVLLLKGGDRGLLGAVLALVIAQVIASFYITYKVSLYQYLQWDLISKVELVRFIQYSWPMIPNALSSWIVSASDKLVITYFMGLEATAINAVAVKIPNMFNYAQSAFSLAWQENATLSSEDDDAAKYYGKMFEEVFAVLVGIMALLIGSTPVLYSLLIRGNYEAAYNQMTIRFIAVIFSAISAYMGGIYIAYMRSRDIGITTVIAAIIKILLNVILIPIIGISAAAVSTLISYAFLSFYRMHDIQKFQKIEFHYGKILSLIGCLFIMAYICSFRILYTNILNLVLGVGLAAILNRRLIQVFVAKVRSRIRL